MMNAKIDELLKYDEYNIYHNDTISDEAIRTLAAIVHGDKQLDLTYYLDLKKSSSKFCWFNYLKIIESLPDDDRIRGIPILFELLKDGNWPTFPRTMKMLLEYESSTLISWAERYYELATLDNDDMWMENIQLLRKRLVGERSVYL